jgi:hypothetical protein
VGQIGLSNRLSAASVPLAESIPGRLKRLQIWALHEQVDVWGRVQMKNNAACTTYNIEFSNIKSQSFSAHIQYFIELNITNNLNLLSPLFFYSFFFHHS